MNSGRSRCACPVRSLTNARTVSQSERRNLGGRRCLGTGKHNQDVCIGCLYWKSDPGWCNYGQITGHSRLASGGTLLPYGGCKLYEPIGSREIPKENWNAIPQKVVVTPLPENMFRQMEYLYAKGMMDKEIARELGCGATTVARWRKKNNLESNYHKK